jgi:radical SAM enzyme (TIGR01210 family)
MSLPRLGSREVLALRPPVLRPTPGNTPLDVFEEDEPANVEGETARVLTILLRGSECSFRCVMCDLWKSTHPGPTPAGAIPAQISAAVGEWNTRESLTGSPGQKWFKLYNASNFFAPASVPVADLPAIASQVAFADRVVVENHPKLLTQQVTTFRDAIAGKLEVAMGLETVHPKILPLLNKQMDLDDFSRACAWLLERDIDIRAFVLLRPPGLNESEGIEWCHRSIEFARQQGVRHVSVVPVRGGNGAVEYLEKAGHFGPPQATSLERVVEEQLRKSAMIVTADLWDWEKLRGTCEKCRDIRRTRLATMNLSQQTTPRFDCRLANGH